MAMAVVAQSPAEAFFLQLFSLEDTQSARTYVERLAAHVSERTDTIEWWATTGLMLQDPFLKDLQKAGLCDRVDPTDLRHVFGHHSTRLGKVDEANIYVMKFCYPSADRELAGQFEVISLESDGSSDLQLYRRTRDYTADEMLEKLAEAPLGSRRALADAFRPAFKALHLPYKY